MQIYNPMARLAALEATLRVTSCSVVVRKGFHALMRDPSNTKFGVRAAPDSRAATGWERSI